MSTSLRVRRSAPLRGTCGVPGDKSISHRALLFGALTDGVVEASGLGRGGDNLSTAAALRALGVEVEISGSDARVHGVGFAGLRAAVVPLDCGNSGTTIRLLAGLLAGRPFETELCGDASLTRRPMRRVAEPLRKMGAAIEGRSEPARPGDIFPPLRIRGGALTGIRYDLPVASAQLKTALILAGLQARGPTVLREPARSRDHTERMLGFLGAPISVDAGGAITVENVGLNPTRAGALDVLHAMGADLTIEATGDAMGEPVGRVRARAGRLHGTRVDGDLALRAIDEIPALAVAAALADGETVFADLAELRIKESDRIAALARELGRAGAHVDERPDGFVVTGLGARPPSGGAVVPEHDHRIAMAGAILGLTSAEDTTVPTADILTSFPTFAETLAGLGASVELTS
ncbi:MAG TPA: 3-phosphoshikimate 1-carboxyvinyltransferase [Polyangia bacterium]